MNNLEFLSPSEKIAALIDGELKINEVGNIFFDISQNSELQEEFVDQIALKNMFNEPVMTPPSGLKTAILSGAGIGAGAVVSAQPNQLMSIANAVVSSKIFLLAISALLSSMLTYLLMMNTSDNPSNLSKNTLNNTPNMQSPQIQVNYPVVKSDLVQEKSIVKASEPKVITIIKYVPVANETQHVTIDNSESYNNSMHMTNESNSDIVPSPNSMQDINVSPIQNIDIDYTLTSDDEKNLTVVSLNHNQKSSSISEITPVRIHSIKPNVDDSQLSINFRGFSNNSFQKIDLPAASEPAINNIGIGLMYHLDESMSVGLEFGQENFIQQYKAVSGNKEYLLKQNYLTFWGGAKAKLVGENSIIVNDLHPFSSLLLGMTNVGPLGKLEMGLTYRVTEKFSLYGAGELTSMFSSYNKQWTSTHKYGISYGMMIKF